MKKTIVFIFTNFLLAAIVSTCVAQNTTTLTPTVAPFKTLLLDDFNGDVTIEIGGTETSLTATLPSGQVQSLNVKNTADQLSISCQLPYKKGEQWRESGALSLVLKTPSLVKMTNKTNCKLRVNGLNTDRFEYSATANTNTTFVGKARLVVIKTTANANIDASQVEASFAEVELRANANVTINSLGYSLAKKSGNGMVKNVNKAAAKIPGEIGTTNSEEATGKPQKIIKFKLRNNTLLPRMVTMISYRPDENGNGTTGFTIVPSTSRTYEFPVGTRIFLAKRKQVELVMSGQSIKENEPFLVVKAEDSGKTFNID